jgi:RimJ/RimL family protein N-acetyltransferase
MSSPASPSAGDPRIRATREIFDRLVNAALREEPDPVKARQRVWQLPDDCVSFTMGRHDADRAAVAALVHELRLRAAEIVETLVDRRTSQQRLAQLLRAAETRCRLRPWHAEDAGTFAALLGDERVWIHLPEPYPGGVDRAMAEQLIAIANGAPDRHLVRAVVASGGVAGQVRLQFDASPFDDSAEISYWLGERFWGRGIATDAVVQMTALAFASRPSLLRVFARVAHGHDASIKVLHKAGYCVEDVCCGDIARDGRLVGQQLLSVWRFDYAGLPDRQVLPRRTSALPAGVLTLQVEQLVESVGVLAAYL